MSRAPSPPEPAPFTDYVEDGARIAGILAVWGVISAFFTYGLTELGLPFERLIFDFGTLLAVTGVLNAVLYVCYRTVDHWHASVEA